MLVALLDARGFRGARGVPPGHEESACRHVEVGWLERRTATAGARSWPSAGL